jgi:hypothetical protein
VKMGQLAIVFGSTIYIFNECHIDVRIFQSLLQFPPHAYKIYMVLCVRIFLCLYCKIVSNNFMGTNSKMCLKIYHWKKG